MFKDILVPATGAESDAAVFATAQAVARDFDAHLTALHARPDPAMMAANAAAGTLGGGFGVGEIINEVEKDGMASEARARASWSAFRSAQAAGAEGADFIATVGDESTRLVDFGRTADLVVIGRASGAEEVAIGRLQSVLYGIGRPLLVAADGGAPFANGTVVIAWKNTAEAARAVGAALPFIARAQQVMVVGIEEDGTVLETEDPVEAEARDRLVRTLRRHNPMVNAHRMEKGDGTAAAAMLRAASDFNANLLVMGGYGHGYLREMIFGGFTQEVLRSATLPVLLMH